MKLKLVKFILAGGVALVLFMLPACSGAYQNRTPSTTPGLGLAQPTQPPANSNQVAIPTNTVPSLAIPSPTTEVLIATGTGPSGPYTQYTQGSLWVQVFSPQDEQLFTQSSIVVAGKAPAGTVLSMDSNILVVPGSGDFSFPLTLVEGPNEIELVASDAQGNELDIILTVSFQP